MFSHKFCWSHHSISLLFLKVLSKIPPTLFKVTWGLIFSLNPKDDKTKKNVILNSVVTGLKDMTQLPSKSLLR